GAANQAFSSIVTVVQAKAAAQTALDLTNAADLASVETQASNNLESASGIDSTAFSTTLSMAINSVEVVNTAIKNITDTDLNSTSTKAIFQVSDHVKAQVKSAASAEKLAPGTGSDKITLTDASSINSTINSVVSNEAPTDIDLSTSTVAENSPNLTFTATSTDDNSTAFTYALSGTDASYFTLNSATGVLTLKASPDYETKSSYSITIKSSDDATVPESYFEDFIITVTDTNDAPTLANAISDQTVAEDSALSFQFASDVFADVDASDSFTYTATLSDDSALPSWLSFDAGTRTFSGTPLNEHVGTIALKVTATDSGSASVTDTFNLTVTNTNDAPTISSTAVTSAIEDFAYSYTIAAGDVDSGDTVTYAATTLP
ncbi:MAG: putative Ig domain-containing protein, partial [Pseudomonadota bacterium]|nr:putative Ig domain-containing protein [Pseudomonadota bacterium]